MTVSLIAAMGKNRVIGKDNILPWELPQDMKRFKTITLNSYIIMGKNNFYSMNQKPLPNRKNIVISTKENHSSKKFMFFSNLENSLLYCKKELNKKGNLLQKEIFIIGGAVLYAAAIKENLVNKIYLTVIDRSFSGDVFFPSIDFSNWNLQEKESVQEKELITKENVLYDNYVYTK